MLDKDFKYFLENQERFVEQYPGKYIILKEKEVVGVYASHAEAHEAIESKESEHDFLIQHCIMS